MSYQNYYYEIEGIFEEFLDSGLVYSLFSNFGSFALSIAGYILGSLALYTLANRRGIKNPWLSWIPVLNCWIVGSLSDQYRYVVKGEIKNKRKTLLILNIISGVIGIAVAVVAVVTVVGAIQSTVGHYNGEDAFASVMSGVIRIGALCLPMIGIGIAVKVIRYMAMYDIYTSCAPQNNVLYLVLSIIFSVTEPFFLFFSRNLDGGMPPRKEQPTYTPPQEPWNQTEYL